MGFWVACGPVLWVGVVRILPVTRLVPPLALVLRQTGTDWVDVVAESEHVYIADPGYTTRHYFYTPPCAMCI